MSEMFKPNSSAFTLIEVMLAIVIALGILVVLLYFYQQTTNLRAQAIQQTEQIAAARLLMDRITGELRTARAESSLNFGLSGTSNYIQFVKTDVPSFNLWLGGAMGRSPVPVTDLKLVRYQLAVDDVTNTAGLLRSEEPLVLSRQATIDTDELEGTNAAPNLNRPIIEEVRFLQFRYWSGTNWVGAWNAAALPAGVEVSLGPEPATNNTGVAEAPAEVFRRVIYLPGSGGTQGVISTNSLTTEPSARRAPEEVP
jgi:type II secretory pathway pseudopilin PulG